MSKPTDTQVAEAIEKGLERPFHPAALHNTLNRFQHAKAAAKEMYPEIVEPERYTCDNIAAVIDKAERAARRVFSD